MKRVITTILMLLISVITVSAQKQYSKEEQAIIGIIQQHYDHWKNRDYDKWENMWVQEPYAGHTWTAPNVFRDNNGWNKVSEMQKNFIKNNPAPAADINFSEFDYTFVIRNNMAIARFVGDGGVHSTTTFEKVKGAWKIIRNDQINLPLFDLRRDINRLGSFEGTWRLVPGSFKLENSGGNWEITNYEMSVSGTSNGININDKFRFRNAQQNIVNGAEDTAIIINSPSSEFIHTKATSFTNFGWTANKSGKVKVEDQSIELDGARVDNEKSTYNSLIKKKSADIISVSNTNGSGEKWSIELKLVY